MTHSKNFALSGFSMETESCAREELVHGLTVPIFNVLGLKSRFYQKKNQRGF